MNDPVMVPLTTGQLAMFRGLFAQRDAIQERVNLLAQGIVLGMYTEPQIHECPLSVTDHGIVFTPHELP